MISITHYLILASLLFCIGLTLVLTRRNAIHILIGVELMFNAANINFVAFSRYDGLERTGQIFALFTMVIAVAEAAVGLALLLLVYKHFRTTNLDEIKSLKD